MGTKLVPSTGQVTAKVTKSGVKQGSHETTLTGFESGGWSVPRAKITEAVGIKLKCLGFKPGTGATITIYERDSNRSDKAIDTLQTSIQGESISVSWKFPRDRWDKAKASARPSSPTYLFVCKVAGFEQPFVSQPMEFYSKLTLTIKDREGKAVSGERVLAFLSNKNPRDGKTDGSGSFSIDNCPVGCHFVEFPNNGFIAPDEAMPLEHPGKLPRFSLSMFGENVFYAGVYVIRCRHAVEERYRFVANPPFFEVVQASPKTQLLPFIPATDEPDEIAVYTDKQTTVKEKTGVAVKMGMEAGHRTHTASIEHTGKHDSINPFSKQFWSGMKNPTVYELHGLRKPVPVKAYSPAQYQISVAIPTPKKYKNGAKLVTEKFKAISDKVDKIKQERTISPFPDEKKRSTDTENQWGQLKHPLAIGTQDRPVTFQVNGKNVEISALDAFGSISLVLQKVMSIKEAFLKNIPKAGWYCDFEVKAFEGTLAYAWGWKEYTDHRAYMGMAISAQVTLLSLNFEVGAGFEAYQVFGQIFAAIDGSLSLSVNVERTSPSMIPDLKMPADLSIAGSVGIRAKVLNFVEAELVGSTGLNLQGEVVIGTSAGFQFTGSLKWTGLKAKIKGSAGAGKSGGDKLPTGERSTAASTEKEWVYLDEKDLGSFSIPSSEKYTPVYITPEKMKEVFVKVFTAKEELSFVDGTGSPLPLDNIITPFVNKVNKSLAVDRTERSVEGIAIAAKMAVKAAAQDKNMALTKIKHTVAFDYCSSKDFTGVLEKSSAPN